MVIITYTFHFVHPCALISIQITSVASSCINEVDSLFCPAKNSPQFRSIKSALQAAFLARCGHTMQPPTAMHLRSATFEHNHMFYTEAVPMPMWSKRTILLSTAFCCIIGGNVFVPHSRVEAIREAASGRRVGRHDRPRCRPRQAHLIRY